MGLNDHKDDGKATNKREKAKAARGRRAKAAGEVKWDGFDWIATIALTEALMEVGGAIRIGKTRDGGAWALGIYVGEDYATEYIRPSEDFTESILEITTAWIDETASKKVWERIIALRAAPPR